MHRSIALLLVLAVCWAAVAATAPDEYRVEFTTTVAGASSSFVVEVSRSWAPLGADRFYELVTAGYYDNNAFFRVVPGFVVQNADVVQFGLAATPELTEQWKVRIDDDPVLASNKRGTVTFATSGPNSRTTQVFINYSDNVGLDKQGFAPFGEVSEADMAVVDAINAEYGQQPNQGAITTQGNAYLEAKFPNLDYMTTVRILGHGADQELSTYTSIAEEMSSSPSSELGMMPHQNEDNESTLTTLEGEEVVEMDAAYPDDDGDKRTHSTFGAIVPWLVLGALALGLAFVAFGPLRIFRKKASGRPTESKESV